MLIQIVLFCFIIFVLIKTNKMKVILDFFKNTFKSAKTKRDFIKEILKRKKDQEQRLFNFKKKELKRLKLNNRLG